METPSKRYDLWWPWSKVKVTVFTWKSENIHLTIFYNISDTIYSRVMTHSQKFACKESLKRMSHLVTLIFSQGHSIYWKFGKYPLLTISDNISDIIQSYDSWPKGSLWRKLQNDVTLGDLDLWWRLQYLLKIWKIWNLENILDSIHSRVKRLG